MASKSQINLSTKTINDLMQSQKVRQALQAKARRILPTAKAIALSDGQTAFANALEISEGTRPGTRSPSGVKRSYARVTAQITDELKKADGYNKLTRPQVLRRAAGA